MKTDIEKIKENVAKINDFLERSEVPTKEEMLALVEEFIAHYKENGIWGVKFNFLYCIGKITAIVFGERALVHYFGSEWGSENVALQDLTERELYAILERFADGKFNIKYEKL